ncbi:Nramp family divalent metal transporter [Oxalobacteraceae bacterium A2-2]
MLLDRRATSRAPQHGAARPGLWRFVGPGFLVAVGYLDPGNWATDLAAGSGYGYQLLWVVVLSSAMAMLLQTLSARLGIVTGMDLAQASRRYAPRGTLTLQWLLCELAICACDFAEVVGTAIALQLLFGLPLMWGVLVTVADVLLILLLQQRGWRYLEALVASLFALVLGCFIVTVALAAPDWGAVAGGLLPRTEILANHGQLYVAIGIIGATVMPHNLYLHSAAVRRHPAGAEGPRQAMRYATIDVMLALSLALLVNAAILVTAGAVFHAHGHHAVAELQEAYHLIGPATGAAVASVLFGVALLAAGQSSSLTATLAGQVIMEGFVRLAWPPWARRLITRLIVVLPTVAVIHWQGDGGIARLLVLSQVVLSLQLPFAMLPLIAFTSSRRVMGGHANGRAVTVIAAVMLVLITALNVRLAWQALGGG